jgi:hypothetical protein
MLIKTSRGTEDLHHPFCVYKYKNRHPSGEWKCLCDLMEEHAIWFRDHNSNDYMVLNDVYGRKEVGQKKGKRRR